MHETPSIPRARQSATPPQPHARGGCAPADLHAWVPSTVCTEFGSSYAQQQQSDFSLDSSHQQQMADGGSQL